MSNEPIFGNIIMLFSRFEMMMQTMEGQIKSYNQELGEQHKRAMELQKENTTLQESLNQLKLENHKLQKDIEAFTHVPEEPMPEQSNFEE
ncbi:MAG: hypothetical protein Q4D33_00970 [Prevotellaceae bacterium]|nr:hypothetical protein [Prevotellaceae bacterium]